MEALAAKIRAGDWDSIDADELKGLLWSLWVDSRENFDLPEYVLPLYRVDKNRTAAPGPWRSGSGPAARDLLKGLFEALKGNGRRKVRSRGLQKWKQLGKLEGRVKLEMTLRYLDAKKEAERRTLRENTPISAFDVLKERLRLSEDER